MTTTSTDRPRPGSALDRRPRSVAARVVGIDAAAWLRVTTAGLTVPLALLCLIGAGHWLAVFASRHVARADALSFTASVLAAHIVLTAEGWRARLNGQRLSRLSWAAWSTNVACGLAATAAVADTWIGGCLTAAPMAVLAALSALIICPRRA